jgi:putative sigma-54 modulation protein
MQLLQLRGMAMEMTPAIESAVRVRVEGLARYTQGVQPAEASVEVGRVSAHHQKGDVFRAEMSVRLGEKTYRAEETAGDLYAAIDAVQEEMKRQILAGKDRQSSRMRRLAQKMKSWMRSA